MKKENNLLQDSENHGRKSVDEAIKMNAKSTVRNTKLLTYVSSFLYPRSKIWIEKNGNLVFGDGRFQLFKTIEETGSINKAAHKLKISYRHAWAYIKTSEERLELKFFEYKRGGMYGGGATLTNDGKKFLKKYELFRKGINEIVNLKFQRVFMK